MTPYLQKFDKASGKRVKKMSEFIYKILGCFWKNNGRISNTKQ